MLTPSLNTPLRAAQKAIVCYDNDCSRLLDVCRGGVVLEDDGLIPIMVQRLRLHPEIKIVRIKNRLDPQWDDKLSAGYRNVMLNVCINSPETRRLNVDHHVAEIQLVPRDVYALRVADLDHEPWSGGSRGWGDGSEGRHTRYIRWRNLRTVV